MESIKIQVKVGITTDTSFIPKDGRWHTYYDPTLGVYFEHYNDGVKNISLYELNKKIIEGPQCHEAHFNIEFIGEPSYDYDKEGNYVPHWGSIRFVGGKIKKFTAHEVDKNSIILDNGSFLIRAFGKYQPNLCIITKRPWINWEYVDKSTYNLPKGDLEVITGRFFKSKKGTLCFDTTGIIENILIRDDWGGAFNDYRGGTLPEKGALYYRRAASNGGGTGLDYAVYPVGWHNIVSIDDI